MNMTYIRPLAGAEMKSQLLAQESEQKTTAECVRIVRITRYLCLSFQAFSHAMGEIDTLQKTVNKIHILNTNTP